MNSAYVDESGSPSFSAQYNPNDGNNQVYYYMQIKVSGAASWSYYNASGGGSLQSSPANNPLVVAPGATFNWSFPTGLISNGNTYNWTAGSASINGGGPYASAFTFVANATPTITVVAPTGTTTNSSPTVEWTYTGGTQVSSRVIFYTAAQQGVVGFTPGVSPSTYDSGTFSNSFGEVTFLGLMLPGGDYYAYVMMTIYGGQTTTWGSSSFTQEADEPATPTVSVSAGTDGTTGCPRVAITVQGQDNLLSFLDSTFEGSVGTWVAGSNSTIAATPGYGLDGNYSMSVAATAGGGVSATTVTTLYVVTPSEAYTVQASFSALGAVARSCTVSVSWYTSANSLISTVTSSPVTDSVTSGVWVKASETAVAPSNAAYARVGIQIAALAASEVHVVDCAGLQPGTATPWSVGGFVGTTACIVLRSDGNYVRGASLANPAYFPSVLSPLDSSGNAANLVSNTGAGVTLSPAGNVFGQAAVFNYMNAVLTGPAGATNAEGAVTGSAFAVNFMYEASGTDMAGTPVILMRAENNSTEQQWHFQIDGSAGAMQLNWYDSSNTVHTLTWSGLLPNINHQYEVNWSGTELYLMVDGVVEASVAMTSVYAATSTGFLVMGIQATGLMDEVRCSSVARHTAGFTPYAVPFTSDGNTGCLYHLDAEVLSEVVTVYDYEVTPYTNYTYTASVTSPGSTLR